MLFEASEYPWLVIQDLHFELQANVNRLLVSVCLLFSACSQHCLFITQEMQSFSQHDGPITELHDKITA